MIENLKKRALHRSRILEGQMRGLQKMIDNEDYCMDIITQSLAIQKVARQSQQTARREPPAYPRDRHVRGRRRAERPRGRRALNVFELTNNRGGK